VERGRQLQAGIKAEETIQLPPRDTKKSEKMQQQIEEDIKHGRELREKYSSENGGNGSADSQDGQPAGNGQDGGHHGERHRDRVREKVQHRAGNGESDDGGRPSGKA
jgi:membrane protein